MPHNKLIQPTASLVGILLFSAAISVFNPAHGDDAKPADKIIKSLSDNISSEYAACAAYFTVTSAALTNSGETDAAEKSDKAADVALQYSREYAKENRNEDMADKVTLSRFQMYTEGMMEEIDNDASNLSILLNKYAYRCKEALEEPVKFAQKVKEELYK